MGILRLFGAPAGLWLGAMVALTGAPGQVQAAPDEFVARVNKAFSGLRAELRSEAVLLPALAKLDPPPVAVRTVAMALDLTPGAPGWSDAESWAKGAPQQAALETLTTLYRVTQPAKLPVFAQPYGAEGIGADLVKAGLYTELGEGGMLGGTRFHYLQGLGGLEILVHVEASRRAEAGEVGAAVNLLTDFAFLARTIADRQFFKEMRWAMAAMTTAVERIRDVAYRDLRSTKAWSPEAVTGIPDLIQRLESERGLLELPRLRIPTGDRVAAEQAIAKVYTVRGGVNESFAPVMASLGASERPLRLFAESARWQAAADAQMSWFDINDELPKVYADWSARWLLDPFDPRLEENPHIVRIDLTSLAVLEATLPPMDELFGMRRVLRVEVVGTRTALGVLGFLYSNKLPPQSLQSVRPKWVRNLDADPFNPRQSRTTTPPLEFFVPMRDQARDIREDPTPHEVAVTLPGGEEFTVSLRDDQFIVYSIGSDGERNMASQVSNVADGDSGTDYLIWPPVRGLWREHRGGGK